MHTLASAYTNFNENSVGLIEPGKDADFIVLSGDPLSVYTHVLQTYVEGKKVFDRDVPADYLIATGGFGVGADKEIHINCFDGDISEGGQN